MTIDQLRAYLNEYADTFDETARTRFPMESFLAWLEAKAAPVAVPEPVVAPEAI